jgi:hypothetical protein
MLAGSSKAIQLKPTERIVDDAKTITLLERLVIRSVDKECPLCF